MQRLNGTSMILLPFETKQRTCYDKMLSGGRTQLYITAHVCSLPDGAAFQRPRGELR